MRLIKLLSINKKKILCFIYSATNPSIEISEKICLKPVKITKYNVKAITSNKSKLIIEIFTLVFLLT